MAAGLVGAVMAERRGDQAVCGTEAVLGAAGCRGAFWVEGWWCGGQIGSPVVAEKGLDLECGAEPWLLTDPLLW